MGHREHSSRIEYSPLEVMKTNTPYQNGLKLKSKRKQSKKYAKATTFSTTEKCPRSIKRRPKSSRLFVGKKAVQRPTSKYRSDFYPENKVMRCDSTLEN
jgi:hypothetical protein